VFILAVFDAPERVIPLLPPELFARDRHSVSWPEGPQASRTYQLGIAS
jgi:hypothetical protein